MKATVRRDIPDADLETYVPATRSDDALLSNVRRSVDGDGEESFDLSSVHPKLAADAASMARTS